MATLSELKTKAASLEKRQLKGLSAMIDTKFMTDSQIVKKIISMKSPGMTDDDLNLLVYGRNLKKELGAKYKAWESEKEAEKEQEEADKAKPKTKREKREKEKKVHKPISKDSPMFDEAKKVKTEIKHKLFLLEEKSKDLAKEVGKLAILIPATISAAVVIAAPPSFNIPGAITLTMSLLNAFTGIQTRLKDFIPLLTVINQLTIVIGKDDELQKVVGSIMAFVTIVDGISKTIASLTSKLPGGNLSESQQKIKQDSLNSINKEIEATDKTLKELKELTPDSDGNVFIDGSLKDSEKYKKTLEKKKEKLADKASKLL